MIRGYSFYDRHTEMVKHYAEPLDWLLGEDTGLSSECIWRVMMGKASDGDVPQDPDDFSRCYRLLKAFPEWRPRMQELADKFPQWKPFVREWNLLTKMFEGVLRNRTENANKMYKVMQQLLEEGQALIKE